jgi:7,8-dihydropterin-6-yl-methyl-4-(beta-D-ribofuranosyl)aminobenzene 5'-phosphate synthase
MRRGIRIMAGKCLCCAAHGLSCLITAHHSAVNHTVLFDTEEYSFERNVTRLGVDLGGVDSIVLSHGHWDHAGAMLLALGMIRGRDGDRKIPYYAHPGIFRSRAVKLPNGALRRMVDIPSIEDLTAFGADVIVTTEPQFLHDGMFFVSGEIPRVTSYERGYPGQVRLLEDGQNWEPDELLMDERFLAVMSRTKAWLCLVHVRMPVSLTY